MALKQLFITQAKGIPEETPFIQGHAEYARAHGLEHRIVTEIDFPAWMRENFSNPYKYGKSFILKEALKEASLIMFAESDVMLTDLSRPVPAPRNGHWLRSGTCRDTPEGVCICPCIMTVIPCPEAEQFIDASLELLGAGFADGYPFDESLFHETRRRLNWPAWDLDPTLCGYPNAEYRDQMSRPWFPGDFAVHISGIPWPHKLEVFHNTVRGPHRLPGISVVVACMDRNERLAATLPSWLNQELVNELLVIDWSSKIPLQETLRHLINVHPKLQVLRVDGQKTFNLGKAYNAALRYISYDTLLKIDADYLLADPSFLEGVAEKRKSGQLLKGFCTGHYTQGIPQLNGLILGHARFLQRTGYREDFEGWGYDDDELYARLSQAPLNRELISGLADKVIHVPHADLERTANYINQSKEDSWQKNYAKARHPQELPNLSYRRIGSRQLGNLIVQDPLPSRTLLSPDQYDMVFGPWRGKRVAFGFNEAFGNVGDLLIRDATLQLFEYYNMQLVTLADAEVAMFTGGGNMGPLHSEISSFRMKFLTEAKRLGVPSVILPQSWSGPDSSAALATAGVFARDATGTRYCAEAKLAPDLALAWRGPVHAPEVIGDHGIFIRQDKERHVELGPRKFSDPVTLRRTVEGYVSLASSCRKITTDRLHFAVAALLAGREVTLLPNSYGKNRGVYEAHLADLGCKWADEIPALAAAPELKNGCDCCS